MIRPFVRGLTVATGFLLFASQNHVAQAQTIFCPPAIPLQSGIALSGGTCTNGTTGALSTASLSSETLSELSQSTTEQASATVGTALGARRETERDRCSDGFQRVNGVCQRIAAPERSVAPPRQTAQAPERSVAAPRQTAQVGRTPASNVARSPRPERREAALVATRPVPFYKAPPPPLEPAVRYAAWVQGIGDYEQRTGTSSTSILCCTTAPGGALPNPLSQRAESRAAMVGVLGGADGTLRSVWAPNDAVIVGALSGYLSSDVRLTTTSTSSTTNVGNGQSTLNAHLAGPSAGAYVTYFNDRFSGDLTFRADFLNLSESFNEILAFTVNANSSGQQIKGTGVQVPFAGAGSTRLNNYTTNGNVNYRIPVSTISWIEPTTGFQYTQSDYDASAAALGLSNGHLVRLQGGARYGIEYYWGPAKLTTTVTGLAYEDVSVTGGFIQNVAFGTNGLIINDQGLLRGQGILAINLAYANGVSLFTQGDVRGGKDLFGAGGKGGIRVTW